MDIENFGQDQVADMNAMIRSLAQGLRDKLSAPKTPPNERLDGLPNVILFPFARHSPYRELCDLVRAFKPKDIWPCTVDQRWIEQGVLLDSHPLQCRD
jgi:hypothetical protein